MIKIYKDLIQGSDEWLQARCGLLTASEIRLIMTPKPEPEARIKKNGEPYKQREWKVFSESDECCRHLYEILGQRITKYVEPSYISDAMLRGQVDEVEARILYSEKYSEVSEIGFMTNDFGIGVTIGYSPDGLVGDDGLIECKSRKQADQVETRLKRAVPREFMLQIQTGLLVSGRKWLDFISYCGGLDMITMRVYPDKETQDAILDAATQFEERLQESLKIYESPSDIDMRLIPTKRRIEQEMFV